MAEKKPDGVKITNQFRSKNGFVYDMKFEETRVTLNITPREAADEAGEWRVDVQMKRPSGEVVFTEWGATRKEAVLAIGRSWDSQASERGLPNFNWNEVVQILSDVRAL